jgi:hypothetical protein
MKAIFFILIMVIMTGTVNAVQPARKPFIHIKVDGTPIKTGEILTVNKGQKLKLEVELEGGRRDFCKFPDSYADVAGTAQILARGPNGLTYSLNGKTAEWKLIKETFEYTSDDFIKIAGSENQPTAELTVSNDKFSQSFVKATVKATWQFSDGETTSLEENNAEAQVYFKIAGASDTWFVTQNIKAGGIKNEAVQEKLVLLQAACDSVEKDLSRLNFAATQQNIRNLQLAGNNLKTTIDEVTAQTPNYQIKIEFIGLPSDHAYSDISLISNIKNAWTSLEPFATDLKQQLSALPEQPTDESKTQLAKLIESYADWESKLPEKTFDHLSQYIPNLYVDSLRISENLKSIKKEKDITNYAETLKDFNAFVDQRIKKVSGENQSLNAVNTRIQAVRLFDGMLRSYFASITWAEWKSTRN